MICSKEIRGDAQIIQVKTEMHTLQIKDYKLSK